MELQKDRVKVGYRRDVVIFTEDVKVVLGAMHGIGGEIHAIGTKRVVGQAGHACRDR